MSDRQVGRRDYIRPAIRELMCLDFVLDAVLAPEIITAQRLGCLSRSILSSKSDAVGLMLRLKIHYTPDIGLAYLHLKGPLGAFETMSTIKKGQQPSRAPQHNVFDIS